MTTHVRSYNINLYKCVTKCIKSSGEHKGVLRARLLKNGYSTVPKSLFLNLRLKCTNNKPRLQKFVKNKKNPEKVRIISYLHLRAFAVFLVNFHVSKM